jgi:hypothetical protein
MNKFSNIKVIKHEECDYGTYMHEAGHAFAAWRFGLTDIVVTFGGPALEAEDTAACVEFNRERLPEEITQEEITIIMVAGPLAEGRSAEDYGSAFRHGKHDLRIMECWAPSEHFRLWDLADDFFEQYWEDIRSLAAFFKASDLL